MARTAVRQLPLAPKRENHDQAEKQNPPRRRVLSVHRTTGVLKAEPATVTLSSYCKKQETVSQLHK
ncbi:MAG: hypothetical protein Tsb002_29700 [Wenzhouxiangellaceae bacterium]